MNRTTIRRILSQAALVIGVVLLSAGVQTYAAFSQPASTPPNSNANAPLTTGGTAEAKTGGLLLNTGGAANGLIVQLGKVGIGVISPTQALDVAGNIKSTGLCLGADCITAWPTATAATAVAVIGTSIAYKAPGTYTYTVPTGVTKIQAIIIGGGGGAASACYVTTTSTFTCSANDQVAGRCAELQKKFVPTTTTVQITTGGAGATGGEKVAKIMSVTPGQNFSIIVGAGGATDSGGAASCFGSDVAKGGDSGWYDSSKTAGFYATVNACTAVYKGQATCGTAPKSSTTNYYGTGEPGSGGSVEILNLQ